jgi:hypothetical protein
MSTSTDGGRVIKARRGWGGRLEFTLDFKISKNPKTRVPQKSN